MPRGKRETTDTAATDTGPFAVVPIAVLNDPNIDDRALRFYIALASYADAGGKAWPSQDALAERLGCSVPTIKRGLKDLVEAGWVQTTKRRDEHGKVVGNHYTVYRALPGIISEPLVSQGSKLSPIQGSKLDSQGSPGDPSIDEQTNLELTIGTDQNNVDLVFETWRKSTEHPRAILDPKRKRIIVAALKAYPVEYVLDAVQGWDHVPFNRGENDRHTVYNELHILLRDSDQIEKFAEAKRNPPTRRGSQVSLPTHAPEVRGLTIAEFGGES